MKLETIEMKGACHKQFLVIALGYWGRGTTLVEAATNCKKAGARSGDRCVASLYTNPKQVPDIRTDGFMVEYAAGSEATTIGVFTLGALLKSKGGAK